MLEPQPCCLLLRYRISSGNLILHLIYHRRKKRVEEVEPVTDITEEKVVPVIGKTINEIYAENGSNGNSLKTNGETQLCFLR